MLNTLLAITYEVGRARISHIHGLQFAYIIMRDEYHSIHDPTRDSNFIFKTLASKIRNDYQFEEERQSNQLHDRVLDSSSTFKQPVFMVDDMANSFIDMKKSFEYVGDNSTFQKRITTIMVVQWIAFSYMVNSMAFLFRAPTFRCRIPLTDFYMPCHQNVACQYIDTEFVKVVYETTNYLNFNQKSITEEFNLICGDQGWAPFSQSIFFLGGFLSGYLFSYISGKIGRRSILLIILALAITSILLCAFSPSFQIFLVGYFLIGFTLFGYETSVYIYIGEISAIRFRTISINMLTMVWAGTPIFLPLLSLIPSWRQAFMFFSGLLALTLPFAYKSFLESPRYLVAKGCYTQARDIFRKISITNRRPPYNFRLQEEIEFENETYLKVNSNLKDNMLRQVDLVEKKRSYNYLDLFKYKSLQKVTLVLMYWWLFRFFMYFGLNLALESILNSGLLLTVVIAGAAIVEVLGSFGITLMTTILYRKYKLDMMRTSLFITTSCLTLMWFLKIKIECKSLTEDNYEMCTQLIVMIGLVVLIKFFNTVFFSGLIGYYSQVFPTPVRSLGCGFTLTFGRLGTIIMPYYINYMKVKYPEKNSLSFMAPFGILAYCLCYIMPYTEEEGMQEQIAQEKFEEEMIPIGTS